MIWDNGLKNDMIVTEEIRTIIGKPHGLDIASIDLRRSEVFFIIKGSCCIMFQ